MLGDGPADGWDGPALTAIRGGMVEAVPLLVARMRMLAARNDDPVMPQDAARIFEGLESMKTLLDDPNRDKTFALRMLQMQFLAKEVISDTAESLEYAVRQGLHGVRVFIAGMRKTLWTCGEPGEFGCLNPESQLRPLCSSTSRVSQNCRINYAHPIALADAAIVLKLCEEITQELKEKISEVRKKKPELKDQLEGKDPLDFLPAFVADTFGPAGQEAIRQFLGISKTHGEWGDHYNSVDSIKLVDCHDVQGVARPPIDPAGIETSKQPQWREGRLQLCRRRVVRLQKELPDHRDVSFKWVQALHWGFYQWWLRRYTCIFQSSWNLVTELPKPLQSFPAAYGPATKASNMATSSKGMEQHWASPALLFNTRSGLANTTLSHGFLLPAFRDPAMDPMVLAKELPAFVVDAAQEMGQFPPLRDTYDVNKAKRHCMKEATKRKLAATAVNSKSGKFTNSNLGGEYRRPNHADVDPEHAKGKTALKRLDRKTRQFLARHPPPNGSTGLKATIVKPAPRSRARGARTSAFSASSALSAGTSSLKDKIVRALSGSQPAQRIKPLGPELLIRAAGALGATLRLPRRRAEALGAIRQKRAIVAQTPNVQAIVAPTPNISLLAQ